MMDHVSRETLERLADGELSADAAHTARRHIKECGFCARKLAAYREFNRRMRAIPTPRLRREFTENVLTSLGIPRQPSLLYRSFEHIASIVAVLFVLGMGGTVWALLALASGEQEASRNHSFQGVGDAAWQWCETHLVGFGNWLLDISPRVPGGGTKIVVMILLMVTAIAILDWLIRRKGPAGEV